MSRRTLFGIGAAAVALLAAGVAAADDNTEALDQRLKIVERQLEIQKEEADAKAKEAASASAGDKGFGLKSGDFEIKFRGLVQADGRFYAGDPAGQNFRDTLLLRRAEPTLDGSLGKLIGFRITAQLAPNSTGAASLVDVYGDLRFDPAATVRVGRFKPPVGLENLESSGTLEFIERGAPNELAPGRDYGLQLQGNVLASTLGYALGLFNGVADGRDAPSSDADNRKEIGARLFFEPFRNTPGLFQGFGLGLGATAGQRLSPAPTAGVGLNSAGTAVVFTATGDTSNALLPAYRSPGQQTVFSYLTSATSTVDAATAATAVVQADGKFVRYAPQAYYYHSGFGLLLEYTESEHSLRRGVNRIKTDHKAYQALTSFVLTGEEASYNGVKPAQPYRVGGDGWGALEVVARYAVLDPDNYVFGSTLATSFADPSKSVTRAADFGGGLNWYLTSNLRAGVNFDYTSFRGGAGTFAAVTDRPSERAIFTRVQYAF